MAAARAPETTPARDDGPAVRAPGDVTRQALLAAAHDLLANEGPGALSVRRIAAAAGVSTMNVYSRFGGKDGVIDELFIDGFQRLTAMMRDDEPTDDPFADLERCGARYRRFALDNPTYYSLMFDRVVPGFEPSGEAQQWAMNSLGRVVERVERAMDAGVIARGDAFSVAAGLWACEHGLVSLEMRSSDDASPFDWDRITRATTLALLRGLTGAGDQPSNDSIGSGESNAATAS